MKTPKKCPRRAKKSSNYGIIIGSTRFLDSSLADLPKTRGGVVGEEALYPSGVKKNVSFVSFRPVIVFCERHHSGLN